MKAGSCQLVGQREHGSVVVADSHSQVNHRVQPKAEGLALLYLPILQGSQCQSMLETPKNKLYKQEEAKDAYLLRRLPNLVQGGHCDPTCLEAH